MGNARAMMLCRVSRKTAASDSNPTPVEPGRCCNSQDSVLPEPAKRIYYLRPGAGWSQASNSGNLFANCIRQSIARAFDGRPSQESGTLRVPISWPHPVDGDIVGIAIAVAAVTLHLPQIQYRITLRAQQQQFTVIHGELIAHDLSLASNCVPTRNDSALGFYVLSATK
jgi:hypothetical protein